MVNPVPLSERAKGRWAGILEAVGVDKAHLSNRHGPCPLCGGKDRFRFDDKGGRGTWFCSQCGAGSGAEMVKRFLGVEFREAALEIERHLGGAPVRQVRSGPRAQDVKAAMALLWKSGRPVGDVPATRAWWERRCGHVPDCADLRGVGEVSLNGCGVWAALLAKVRDPEGHWVNLHRTFLTADGEKAPIDDPRRVMALPLPKGSAVRLSEAAPAMGVAEGMETAVSASLMAGVPVWAALNANGVRGFTPPACARWFTVYGDQDESFEGQSAAFTLARSLWAKRKDWEGGLHVSVAIPGLTLDGPARDWNDEHAVSREADRIPSP
jgi:putative DNA primase/helicase